MTDNHSLPRVAVLMGGRSAEREVSLNTGTQVAAALEQTGYEVVRVDAGDDDFVATLQQATPDVVFICLHGRYGEDGTMQGLLEILRIPYVGSGVLASALAMEKVMCKHFFDIAGVLTPAHVAIRRGEPVDIASVTAKLGPKTVVKPTNEGSAIGVTIAHTAEELPSAIEEAFVHDDSVMIEQFIEGVETTVGVLGNKDLQALPTLEIVPEHEFYDYESKYVPGMSKHIVPARITEEQREECERLAIEVHEVLGCRGMSRTDMIITGDGEIYVLEINTIPGMTSTSLLPDAAVAAGIEFPDLCRRLVELALEDE